MSKTKNNIGIYITLLLFLSLGLCYSYYTPLWCPPDEERHFVYCEYIAQNHRLPDFKYDPEENIVHMGYQAPLYYLFGSFFCKDDGKLLEEEIFVNDGPGFNSISHPKEKREFPYSGKARSAHLLRVFSLALSTVTIYLIYLTVMKIFPGEMTLASAAALFVATIPQFLHISASVSNINMFIAFSTAYILSLLYYLENPSRLIRQVASGLLLGCCLLSKSSALYHLPLTAGVIGFVCFRDRRNPAQSLLVVFGLASLVSGWWYLQNWLIFNDPLFAKTIVAIQPWLPRHFPASLSYITMIIGNTFLSFFGNFGTLAVPIPATHLSIYGGILLLGIAGLYRLLAKRQITSFQSQALGLLFLSLLGGIAFLLLANYRYINQCQGRYLFSVISPVAVITFAGLRYLFHPRWRNTFFIVLCSLLIVLNLNVLFNVLKPAYSETNLKEAVEQPIFCCPTAQINSSSTLGQTFVSPRDNLCTIRVMFSCKTNQKRGEITFVLREAGNNEKVLYRMKYPLKKIENSTRCYFIFPPIKNSSGKKYVFSFTSPSLPGGKGVSLWYESKDCYPDGSMLVNNEPAAGDLYFTAYYFTGKYPKTVWEGKKQTVINQGTYVNLRELQFYHERSKDFREKTITHEKIMRFTKAQKNRIQGNSPLKD